MLERHAARLRFRTCEGELESDHLMREAIRGHQRQSRELESDHLRLLLHRRAEGACVGGLLRRVVERVAESGNLKVE